jgi:hypothetical protein
MALASPYLEIGDGLAEMVKGEGLLGVGVEVAAVRLPRKGRDEHLVVAALQLGRRELLLVVLCKGAVRSEGGEQKR